MRVSSQRRPVSATRPPSAPTTITSKLAADRSGTLSSENSGRTPIIGPVWVIGSVRSRSTARPPASRMRTAILASSGRVVSGSAGAATGKVARPSASVRGSPVKVSRTGVTSSSSRPKR